MGDLIADQFQLVLTELLRLQNCLQVHQGFQTLLRDGVERAVRKVDLCSCNEGIHISIKVTQVNILTLIRGRGLFLKLVAS